MVTLQVRLFNHLELQFNGQGPVALRPRARRLLVYLLLNRKASLLRKNIAFTLWPDVSEDESLGMLRRALSDLRAGLPHDEKYLIISRDIIRWNPDASYWLDVDEFESQIQNAEPESLHLATDLYTGDLLRDMDEEWLLPERERCRQMQFNALRQLVAHYQACQNYTTALDFTRRALTLEPFSELVYQDRMRLRFLAGDRAAALAEYERLQSVLENELGVQPMDETRLLVEAITRGDPLGNVEVQSSSLVPIPQRLVGRERETSKLTKLWDAASQRHGNLAIISGEAGIGKSHLIQMLAYQVSRREGLPLVGHCYEFEKTLPYQPILETLRSAASLLRGLSLSRSHRSALTRLLPDIFESEETKSSLSPDDLRIQLFEGLLQAFLLLSQRQPVLLIIEDMHWASESVLDWLTFIAPRLEGNRLMVAITYRTDEVDTGHALQRLARRFEREDIVTTISLKRLTREENREWVAHLSGWEEKSASHFADRLFSEALGNPFFLQEIVRGMLETGQIQLENGRWFGAIIREVKEADIPLPDSLRETILARTSRLSELARSFLQAAATAGREFNFKIVSQAGGWAEESSLKALEELSVRGFVRESSVPGTFVFTHHLLREAVYSDLTSPRQVYWHLHLAQSIQKNFADDHASLAYHFTEAGESELGIRYSKMAAEHAEALYAYEEARQYLQNALDLVGDKDAGTRLELLEGLADSYRFLRQGSEALENYKKALALWGEQKDADRIVYVRINRKIRQTTSGMWESTNLHENRLASHVSKGLKPDLNQLMRMIEELEPHEETVRLLRELTVDSLIFHFPQEKDDALHYARLAVNLAEKIDAPLAISSALLSIVIVYGALGLLRERVDVALQALKVCEDARVDDPYFYIQVLLTTAKSMIDVGEYHQAVTYLQQAETLAREMHAVHEESQALSLLHQCWFRLDRWNDLWAVEAKRRRLQEAYPLRRIGAPCFAIGLSSVVYHLQGNIEKARELREESYEIMVSVAGTIENWQRSGRY